MISFKKQIILLIVLSFCFGVAISSLGAMKRSCVAMPKKRIKVSDAEAVLIPVVSNSQPTSAETNTSSSMASNTFPTLISSTSSTEISSTSHVILGERPAAVQKVCNEKFQEIKGIKPNKWGYDGSYGAYGILGLSDELILKDLAFKQGKKDIYIIDVGCARGAWGEFAMKVLLNDEKCKKSGKHFYIFSVTGGRECENKFVKKENVTHYIYNQFRIENIYEEFLKKNFDLKGKVDVIVSRCTLQHLTDPCGTLKCMYGLLTPLNGLLLANNFFFSFYDDLKIVEKFPSDRSWNLIANTNIPALFRVNDNLGNASGEFILMRINEQELEIYLEYKGDVIPLPIDSEYQFASCALTVFKKGDIKPVERFTFDENEMNGSFGYYPCYCDKNNKRSIYLYEYLKSKNLFIWQSDAK